MNEAAAPHAESETLVPALLREYGDLTRVALCDYLGPRAPERHLYNLVADYPRRGGRMLRPSLDAAQVMPPFVYLVPFLALFGATRFTAIVAAVVYAAPVAIKIMADGIRGVSTETVEAAQSVGSNRSLARTDFDRSPLGRSWRTMS